MTLHQKHLDWLAYRGISEELATRFGLFTTVRSFPIGDKWEKAQCIAIPYLLDGKVVNHKYRRVDPKQHVMDTGGTLCLWNRDCLLEESDKPVVICEGEWDAMTAISLGWRAVSVPNGSSGGNGRLSYLWDTKEELNRVKSFIVATDSDTAGIKLRANIVHNFGAPDRFSFTDRYGADCKDLNDTLQHYGEEAAGEVLDGAKPYPVSGVNKFDDFPDQPPIETFGIGIDVIADMIFIVPGTLTVFTGYSNMGKTTVMNTIIAHAINSELHCCLAIFEGQIKPGTYQAIGRAVIGCGWSEYHHHPMRKQAERLMQERTTLISNALDEGLDLDLDVFLEKVRIAIQRDGAKLVVLDPWNELEHKRRRDETMTEYVGRAIRRIKAFAKLHNVAFWIIAHPTKPAKGTNTPPGLYDISDSAAWANKADYGLTYHRQDKENNAQIIVTKVRGEYPGRCGSANVMLDFSTCRVKGI